MVSYRTNIGRKMRKLIILFTAILYGCGGGGGESSSAKSVCPPKENTVVFFIAGQSNAANVAQNSNEKVSPKVFQYVDSKCYPAKSPLMNVPLHPSPNETNYFNLFQQVMVDYSERTGKNVIFSVYAINGASIKRFIDNAEFTKAYNDLNTAYGVNYFLWQQGESDARDKMTFQEYSDYWQRLISGISRDVIILTARSTVCGLLSEYDNEVGLFQSTQTGPNTDMVPKIKRYDECHFNSAGVADASILWNNYLK